MRRISVQDAVGEALCHDMTAIRADGFKGVQFPRGHVVREGDIPVLLDMGKSHIFVWEPAADEVHEEDAGLAGAVALAGAGISYGAPREGRYALTADYDGLLVIDSKRLLALNQVPDFTAATRPNLTAVVAGAQVAGVRIVPLVTAREHVAQVEALGRGILEVRPFLPLKVGCIITGREIAEGRIPDRFEPILREKTTQYGGQVLDVEKCPDDAAAIVATTRRFLDLGAELLLFTGGMSVDPDDLTPTAIRQTGAEVIAQGVPVQPGNMLMLAYLGETTLIGVPGAAMHHQITSLDLILPRVFAGVRITRDDLLSLGEGGLLLPQSATLTAPS